MYSPEYTLWCLAGIFCKNTSIFIQQIPPVTEKHQDDWLLHNCIFIQSPMDLWSENPLGVVYKPRGKNSGQYWSPPQCCYFFSNLLYLICLRGLHTTLLELAPWWFTLIFVLRAGRKQSMIYATRSLGSNPNSLDSERWTNYSQNKRFLFQEEYFIL